MIWIISSRSVPIFSKINDQEVIFPYLFAFNFSSNVLVHPLAFAIERNIALGGDACFRPPITIKSHDLHACDIRKAVGEKTSYHEKD
jgi:hypothetical protein